MRKLARVASSNIARWAVPAAGTAAGVVGASPTHSGLERTVLGTECGSLETTLDPMNSFVEVTDTACTPGWAFVRWVTERVDHLSVRTCRRRSHLTGSRSIP